MVQKIIDPTAVASLPARTSSGTSGYFAPFNPLNNQQATIVTADFLNSLIEENVNLLAAAGMTPDATKYTQVLDAIKFLFKAGDDGEAALRIAADNAEAAARSNRDDTIDREYKAAIFNEATQRSTVDSNLFNDYIQRDTTVYGNAVAYANNNVYGPLNNSKQPNCQTYAATTGYAWFPGNGGSPGFMVQWGSGSTVGNGQNWGYNFATYFPNACVSVVACESSSTGWAPSNPTVYGVNSLSQGGFAMSSMRWETSSWVYRTGLGFNYIAVGF